EASDTRTNPLECKAGAYVCDDFTGVIDAGAHGRNDAAKGEPFERPVASVRRETAARAPEIPAGHGPAVQPTSRGSCRFPGRREVRRAASFRPLCSPATMTAYQLGPASSACS